VSGATDNLFHLGKTMEQRILFSHLEETNMSTKAARIFTDTLSQSGLLSSASTLQVRGIQDLYDRHQPNISTAEGLYAFFGHLCNLKDPIVLGVGHNPVRIHDLITKFCELNNIPDPEPGWEKRLNPKFYKEGLAEESRCPNCNQTITLEKPKEVTEMDGNCIMHNQPLTLCNECRDNQVNNALQEKTVTVTLLRDTLITISVEDCACSQSGGLSTHYRCPRCRALEVLDQTKGG